MVSTRLLSFLEGKAVLPTEIIPKRHDKKPSNPVKDWMVLLWFVSQVVGKKALPTLLGWIEMQIIEVVLVVAFIAQGMFPKSPLPDTAPPVA